MYSQSQFNYSSPFIRYFISFLITLTMLIGTSGLVFAADGDLDPDFGEAGNVSAPFYNANSNIEDMVLQSDGKIVMCGSSTHDENVDFHLVRLNSDGSLDQDFGLNGMVMTDIDEFSNTCSGIVIQNDGKIVAVGQSYHPYQSSNDTFITLVRYNSNGSLDSSFGMAGIVRTNINIDMIEVVSLVLNNNKILVGVELVWNEPNDNFVLLQYDDDGSIDSSFGINGAAYSKIINLSSLSSMAVHSDGKVLVSGTIGQDIGLVRFNIDGSIDTDFGIDGIATADIGGGNDYGRDLAIQANEKIVVVGYTSDGLDSDFAMVRFSTSGSLDMGFGVGGAATCDFNTQNDYAHAVAIQSDGKIVTAGYTSTGTGQDIAVARFNSNGLLDGEFGLGGMVEYVYESGYGNSTSIVFQGNDIIIGGGWSDYLGWSLDKKTQATLISFTNGGTLETSFGNEGIVIFKGVADAQIQDVLIQSDGKILVAGYTSGYMFDDIYLARYERDGSLDTTFGEDGIVVTSFSDRDDQAKALALQSDGKILVIGTSYYSSDGEFYNYKMMIVRYTQDGTLDTNFGNSGVTFFDNGNLDCFGTDVAQLSNGKIVIVGQQFVSYEDSIIVVRFSENGSVEGSYIIEEFNTEFASARGAIVVDENDNIYISGYGNDGGDDDIALACLDINLNPEPSFGSLGTGVVLTDLEGESERGEALVLQDNTRLIIAGFTEGIGGMDFVLVGYTFAGELDTSFGINGYVVTSIGSGDDMAWDMAYSGDGRIVVAGQSNNGSDDEIAVVRYSQNGLLDTSFGTNGIVTTAIGTGGVGKAVALEEDEKIVLAGFSTDGLHRNIALLRYLQAELKYKNYLPLTTR